MSCGTHVHMSHSGITRFENDLFPAALNRVWLHYQQDMNHTFYPDRINSRYAENAKPGVRWDERERHKKLNFMPLLLDDPRKGVHVEFRGLGEIIKKRGSFPFDELKRYLHALIGIWEKAIVLSKEQERALDTQVQQVEQRYTSDRNALYENFTTFGGRTNLGKIGIMCVLQRALSDRADAA